MALTQNERRIIREVVIEKFREEFDTGSANEDFAALFDPETNDAKDRMKSLVVDFKAALLAEQASLVSNAQARNSEINAIVAVIDGLLAKFP